MLVEVVTCNRVRDPGGHQKQSQIGHHAGPRRATATAPLRTGADTCQTGSGAGKGSGAKADPVHRRSNHAWTEDQTDRRKRANVDAVGGWRVHTVDDTPSKNAVTRSKHCSFTCQGDTRPRAAAGSSSNGTTQDVAATTEIRLDGNAASNAASAWSDPEHPQEVIPEKGMCNRAVQARDILSLKQQVLNVVPSVFPSRLNPRSRTKIRTRGEDMIVAERTRCSNSCVSKVKTMVSDQV